MEVMRLVVTGPVGAGKSTFIRSVSEIEVVDTDCIATDETKDLKQKTTVALDFGKLNFGSNMALHNRSTTRKKRLAIDGCIFFNRRKFTQSIFFTKFIWLLTR